MDITARRADALLDVIEMRLEFIDDATETTTDRFIALNNFHDALDTERVAVARKPLASLESVVKFEYVDTPENIDRLKGELQTIIRTLSEKADPEELVAVASRLASELEDASWNPEMFDVDES